jgi:hypothetical protein
MESRHREFEKHGKIKSFILLLNRRWDGTLDQPAR